MSFHHANKKIKEAYAQQCPPVRQYTVSTNPSAKRDTGSTPVHFSGNTLVNFSRY